MEGNRTAPGGNAVSAATPNEPDYYAVIGVPSSATPEEIRRIYGERVREAQSDQTRFQALVEAYEILKDTAKRAAYDRRRRMAGGDAADAAPAGEAEPNMANSDATEVIPPGGAPPRAPAATQVIRSGGPGGNGFSLPTVCAMDLSPCPLLSGNQAPDEGFCPECGFLLGSTLGGAVKRRPLPKLVDMQGREFPLKSGENSVGREGADVVIPHNTVSRKHARLVVDASAPTTAVTLEDMGSTNGTRISGTIIPKQQRTGLRDRQVIQFGAVKLTLIIPEPEEAAEELPAIAAPEVGVAAPVAAIAAPEGGGSARLVGAGGAVTHTLMAEKTSFGRRPGNTVLITDDTYISGNHAEITFVDGKFVLTDLGSTNGTQVNGKRLEAHSPVALKDGDAVTMGTTEFVFYAPR